jgi:hypothetical protein
VSVGGAPPPSIVVVLQAENFYNFYFCYKKKIMFCFEEREKGVNVLMK